MRARVTPLSYWSLSTRSASWAWFSFGSIQSWVTTFTLHAKQTRQTRQAIHTTITLLSRKTWIPWETLLAPRTSDSWDTFLSCHSLHSRETLSAWLTRVAGGAIHPFHAGFSFVSLWARQPLECDSLRSLLKFLGGVSGWSWFALYSWLSFRSCLADSHGALVSLWSTSAWLTRYACKSRVSFGSKGSITPRLSNVSRKSLRSWFALLSLDHGPFCSFTFLSFEPWQSRLTFQTRQAGQARCTGISLGSIAAV